MLNSFIIHLTYRLACGESAIVDLAMVDKWKKDILPSLVENYAPQNIFNVDEADLFYNLLPDETCTIKE